MFLSRRSHAEIVAQYEARLKDAAKREADLETDRNYYRDAWLTRLGMMPPIPKPADVTAITPSAPVTVPIELEERKTLRLDKSGWSKDDHEFYEDYHVAPSAREGVPPEEMDYHYLQKYGNESPLTVFIDSALPV